MRTSSVLVALSFLVVAVAARAQTPCTIDADCLDTDVCNGDETCVAGSCTPGTPLDCDDGNACTTDTCDPTLGCQHANVLDTSPCPDTDPCNGAETCVAGVCSPGSALNCSDGNPCTLESCVPGSGCQSTIVPDTTPCPDADPCNGTETCIVGTCTSGTPLVCDDGDPCTFDSCDAVAGCQHGAACDDGNPLTADTCDALGGCRHAATISGTLFFVRVVPNHVKVRLTTGPIALTPPTSNGGPNDPVLHGATLRVVAGALDRTYVLPAANWRYVGPFGGNSGYRYKEPLRFPGIIRKVTVRGTGSTTVSGEWAALSPLVATDPTPASVVLNLGTTGYCMSFGGTTIYAPGFYFKAKNAPAPGSCPP